MFEQKTITKEEFLKQLDERKDGEVFEISHTNVDDIDLSGRDLSKSDFSYTIFRNCDFTNANLSESNLHCTSFLDCKMPGVDMSNCNLVEANLRYMDLTNANICGSNIYRSILEHTKLDGIKSDENTKWFRLHCPEEGPFIAWKCCTEWRVVQLLVPADAKRVSATGETCRCSKAKVLSIKSIDETVKYDWAQSTVDPDFYYEVGKWVEPANGFCEERWCDSSEGIHFFMEREECVAYQTV